MKQARALIVVMLLLSGLYAALLKPALAQNEQPKYSGIVALLVSMEGQRVRVYTRTSTQHDAVSFSGSVISANEEIVCLDDNGYGNHCVVTSQILDVDWYPS